MLNKPIKFRKMAMFSLALLFWLSGVSLFAQNNQTSPIEPEKKQLPTAQPKVSLSNQEPKALKQDAATQNKVAMEQKRKEEQAIAAKKQNLAKENVVPKKTSKEVASTSSKAPVNSNQSAEVKSANFQKDWEVKKAKLIQSMKDKNYSQQEIDRIVSKTEKEMKVSSNNSKK
jgi:hypothetical protein